MSFACGCGVERSAKCLVQVSVAQGSSSAALCASACLTGSLGVHLPHPRRAHSVGVGDTEAYAAAVCRGSPACVGLAPVGCTTARWLYNVTSTVTTSIASDSFLTSYLHNKSTTCARRHYGVFGEHSA